MIRLVLFVLALAALPACGRTWDQWGRVGVAAAAHGLVGVDAVAAARYAHDVTGLGVEAFAPVDARYAALERGETAARDALQVLESGLDAYQRQPTDAGRCGVLDRVRDALAMLARVGALARDLGATVPADLDASAGALGSALGILRPLCATATATPAADGGTGP